MGSIDRGSFVAAFYQAGMHPAYRNSTGMLMHRVVPALLLLSCLLFLACSRGPQKQEGRAYRVGYMVCNSEEETLARFRPLTAFLSKKLGVPLEAVAIDTIDFSREAEKLDFTHTNSLLYIILNRNHGVEVLAAEKAGSLGARSLGAIVALKKSGIKDIRDLKGKTMVFGPMLAPTAYLTQLDLLVRNGIDPENDLAFYSIPPGSFKHEKVIYSVLFGKFDAGAFPMLDFERMSQDGRIEAQDFVVIAEGDPIPYCNFGATQKVDDSLARKFRKVLLEIRPDDTVEVDGETVRVLQRAQIEGYEEISDRDFDGIREMAKRTSMPPYQKY